MIVKFRGGSHRARISATICIDATSRQTDWRAVDEDRYPPPEGMHDERTGQGVYGGCLPETGLGWSGRISIDKE